jgi:hypothetical protein
MGSSYSPHINFFSSDYTKYAGLSYFPNIPHINDHYFLVMIIRVRGFIILPTHLAPRRSLLKYFRKRGDVKVNRFQLRVTGKERFSFALSVTGAGNCFITTLRCTKTYIKKISTQ